MSKKTANLCDFCGMNKTVKTTIREAGARMGKYSTCNHCESIDTRYAFKLARVSPEDKLIMIKIWWKGKKSNETLSGMYPKIDWSMEDEGDLDGILEGLERKYKPTQEELNAVEVIKYEFDEKTGTFIRTEEEEKKE